MQIVHNTCGDRLPDVGEPLGLDVEADSELTECGQHWIRSALNGFPLQGHWCDELIDFLLEPTEQGYLGTFLYELNCGTPGLNCQARVEVVFR
jgi:hypothetical protein